MQLKSYIAPLLRAFLLAIVIGVLTIIGELIFVLAMGWSSQPVPFTSFYAVALFSVLMGFLPLQPSPSRISSTPINFIGRLLLVIEISVIVGAAILASSKFMAFRHIVIPVDLAFAAYAYGLILIVMLIVNFGRLKQEIS